MGDYERQHFVPQSYLRRFSKNEKQIEVYDKILQKSFPDGIRNVAQRSHFYTIPDEVIPSGTNLTEDEKLSVEKAFHPFEDKLNSLIKIIITLPPGIAIPKKIREDFSILIAVQLLRTRSHRKLIEEATEKFYKAIAQDLIKENFGEEALKYTPTIKLKEKHVGVIHSQQIFNFDNLAKMAKVFFNHIWLIGINNTKNLFYTSDNPVVMHTPLKKQLRGVGISSLGIEIAYPLSSQYILILADREVYADYELFDGKSSNLEAENVEYYNSLQVIHSDRQIFCEEQDFDLAKDMIKKSPNLSNPESNRVKVEIVDKYS